MGNTKTVYARSPGKSEPLPELPYVEGHGEAMLRKLPRTRLALAIRLAMIAKRAGRK